MLKSALFSSFHYFTVFIIWQWCLGIIKNYVVFNDVFAKSIGRDVKYFLDIVRVRFCTSFKNRTRSDHFCNMNEWKKNPGPFKDKTDSRTMYELIVHRANIINSSIRDCIIESWIIRIFKAFKNPLFYFTICILKFYPYNKFSLITWQNWIEIDR